MHSSSSVARWQGWLAWTEVVGSARFCSSSRCVSVGAAAIFRLCGFVNGLVLYDIFAHLQLATRPQVKARRSGSTTHPTYWLISGFIIKITLPYKQRYTYEIIRIMSGECEFKKYMSFKLLNFPTLNYHL